MPPKPRVVLQSSPAKRRQPRDGLLNNAYWELTSSENATIMRSVVYLVYVIWTILFISYYLAMYFQSGEGISTSAI